MGDHTESISIDYDPANLSFEEFLGHFWSAHHCERNHPSPQYRNVLFFRNEAQRDAALASREVYARTRGLKVGKVATEIRAATEFTYAEGYHQKYYLTRHKDLRGFLESCYPAAKELADSTVATRLNAFLGSGMDRDWEAFLDELPAYGLPESLEASVRTMVP